MRPENVKIGMKVIPHSKLLNNTNCNFIGGADLFSCGSYISAKEKNQNYLYVVGIYKEMCKYENDNIVYVLNDVMDDIDGDYFFASDFEPELKTNRKLKLQNICSKEEIK